MFDFLSHLFANAFDLTPEQRQRSVRIAAWVGGLLVLVVLFAAGRTAGQVVPAEHPIWEAVLQTRLALVRLVMALPLPLIGTVAGVVIYQVFENSELGKRLVVPAGTDDAHVEAQKVRNGGAILAALVGACILGFMLGVLR